MAGGPVHNFLHSTPVQIFHWFCAASMVLMFYNPVIATWAANYASGLVSAFGNTGPALSTLAGVFKAKAGATVASAPIMPAPVMPSMPGMDHMMMGGMHHGM